MDHEQARYKLKLNLYGKFLSLTFLCESISLFELFKFLSYASICVKDLYIFWLTTGNIMGRYTMIILIFILRHAGLCGILGNESLRPSIFCHQLNKYSAYLDIYHCHHHLSHEKYFYNTTKHFYLWVFSWGSSFE